MPYSTVPPELVAAVISATPVSRDDLNHIRDPREPSRFCGVYGHRHGGANRGDNRYRVKAYRARVFKFWELGSGFETRELAARAVVAFYKCYLGDNWARAFRQRKVAPYRCRAVRAGEAMRGVRVDLYIRGRPVCITKADAGQGRSTEWLWPDHLAAKEAAKAAMHRMFLKERGKLPIPAMGLMFWRS